MSTPIFDAADHKNATDGRLERTVATRRAILLAARELMVHGNSQPTAKAIADQAGVTTRTLFRHFREIDELYSSLVKEAVLNINAVMDEPFQVDTTNWSDQLDEVVNRRARLYEFLLPLYVSSAWLRGMQGIDLRHSIQRRRRRLNEILPPQLSSNKDLFEALDATLSIEFWVSLRRGQHLSTKRAKLVVQHTTRALT